MVILGLLILTVQAALRFARLFDEETQKSIELSPEHTIKSMFSRARWNFIICTH